MARLFGQIRAFTRSDDFRKMLRYCAVSAVNVPGGQLILAICINVFKWNESLSNVIAVSIITIPAYLLSRAWVWEKQGAHGVRSEVLPFWILAFVGLVFSTALVQITTTIWEPTWVANAANLTAYGIMWVVKYVVLDRYLFAVPEAEVEPEMTPAASPR